MESRLLSSDLNTIEVRSNRATIDVPSEGLCHQDGCFIYVSNRQLYCWLTGAEQPRVVANLGDGFDTGVVRVDHPKDAVPVAVVVGQHGVVRVPLWDPKVEVSNVETVWTCSAGHTLSVVPSDNTAELWLCLVDQSGNRTIGIVGSQHRITFPEKASLGPTISERRCWALGESGVLVYDGGSWREPRPMDAESQPYLKLDQKSLMRTGSAPMIAAGDGGAYWMGIHHGKPSVLFLKDKDSPLLVSDGFDGDFTFATGHGAQLTTVTGRVQRHIRGASTPLLRDEEINPNQPAFILAANLAIYVVRRAGGLTSLRLRNFKTNQYCDLPVPKNFLGLAQAWISSQTVTLQYRRSDKEGFACTSWDLIPKS